jgi:hypothetical protein
MSAILCPPLSSSFCNASNIDSFFGIKGIRDIERAEAREQRIVGKPGESCKTNLFFGFFFDGTKNNYVQAEKTKNHSNVARLYDCYPGLSVPGVLPAETDWKYKSSNYTHFFKTYIPGVASPFKEVNDDGKGWELTRGAATGYRGEARITWALIQAVNNVHRYFHKAPLVSSVEAAKLTAGIDLSPVSRRAMTDDSYFSIKKTGAEYTRDSLKTMLERLHMSVSQHWPDKVTGRPKKIDPGMVQTIHVSIFGFSRGATQARVFTNWLVELCKLDARLVGKHDAMTLGGFPVKIDFLGLFDTVASVGAGNTFGNSLLGRMLDGHDAWADSEGLRIPAGVPCVHLVAAHEVRRSFPLDSIAVGQMMPDGCSEVVFPGVHSDIGSGYCPREQGRGIDPEGADMLARVPLVYMYKQARIAGVPLKLEFASDAAQRRFQIAPATITGLNSYLGAAVHKEGWLTSIMREQGRLHMQWHLARRVRGHAPRESTGSFARATVFDQNDLHSANLEFESEIAAFETWLSEKGKDFAPKTQVPGFKNDHEAEWEEIATWWKKAAPPPQSVLTFFDEYVHDSRAWFKLVPGNPDSEADMHTLLREWIVIHESDRARNALAERMFLDNQRELFRLTGRQQDAHSPKYRPLHNRLTDAQRKATEEYIRTKKIPGMLTEGREPFQLMGMSCRAGYLRYRKIYGGSDSVLLSDASTHQLQSANFV